ncbi:hypothetical protein Ddye_021871 [Dipteronia dyeriana]|uniref:Ribosomal protein L33 n=1 Tax=Dipteronia dyeriana TaxID=168575 RepID=A0AAD9U2H7_9ROSI|nr:hypothetical protein Ddye_021871 [Dipteronia dyeriana]
MESYRGHDNWYTRDFLTSDQKIETLGESKTQRRFIAKGKDVRVRVILECTSCVRNSVNKESTVISK